MNTTTTTTTTTDAMASIRIDILMSRTSDMTYDTFTGMVDAKIIRTKGGTEVWSVTLQSGRTVKVIAQTDVDLDF
jgi:hypothetical protein